MSKESYKKHEYRLAEETVERIKMLKSASGLTYNLFFRELLDLYEQEDMPEVTIEEPRPPRFEYSETETLDLPF